MAQDGRDMTQDGPIHLSRVFILGRLRRSLALPSLRIRFVFDLPLLCLRFAVALCCHRLPNGCPLGYAVLKGPIKDTVAYQIRCENNLKTTHTQVF